MKGVIMAGGEGTRLRPLTSTVPKPLLPVANRPMMEHVIDLLRKHGIEEIVVTVAFMANSIKEYWMRRNLQPCYFSSTPRSTPRDGERHLRSDQQMAFRSLMLIVAEK